MKSVAVNKSLFEAPKLVETPPPIAGFECYYVLSKFRIRNCDSYKFLLYLLSIMSEVADFKSIDKMVSEYMEFRQSDSRETDRSDEIVEKFMTLFDLGDYENLIHLWDIYISQKLDLVDSLVVQDASIAEFYMHVHCAICPFRPSVTNAIKNPAIAGKMAARSMTIFKHYVEIKGKLLVSSQEFHVSTFYIFYNTTYFQFIINFLVS